MSNADSQRKGEGLQAEIEQRQPFANPETEAFLNIARTSALLMDESDRFMKEHGLTGVLYNVLRIVRGAGEPVPCSVIARRMLTRVPDVTRLIDRLVEKGLVERQRTEEDRRLVLVTLSKTGKDLLARMDEPAEAVNKAMLGHMSREELHELSRLLVKARSRMGRDR